MYIFEHFVSLYNCFFRNVLFETKTLHGIFPYLNSEITRLKVTNFDRHIICTLCSVPYLVSHNNEDKAQLLPEEVSDDTACKVRVLRSASDGPSLPKRAPPSPTSWICRKNQYITDTKNTRHKKLILPY